jgi:diacylglycerol kinase family enzyme
VRAGRGSVDLATGGASTGAPVERAGVVLNVKSGSGKRSDDIERVRAALAAANIRATLWPAHGREIVAVARRAVADSACVIAAGGDGTVSAVAGVVAGTGKVLGVLPAGTLNHFAKDLGIPPRIEDAAAALARARVRRIDVGEVNGIVFVNNSSVGIYPRVVRGRERLLARFGRGKWLATAWAVAAVASRLHPLSIRLRWEGGAAEERTTFVFVGNNRYDTALLATQRRQALDAGVLGVFVGRERTPFGLLRLGARAALGRLDERDLETLDVREVTLESHRGTLWVALDGEVRRLRPPIRYRVRPGALQVLAPAPQP